LTNSKSHELTIQELSQRLDQGRKKCFKTEESHSFIL